jgi:hypothetical protein
MIDTYSPSAIQLRDLILALPDDSADRSLAKALVKDFDGHLALESSAALLIEAFRAELMQALLRPLGSAANVAAGAAVTHVERLGSSSAR